MRKYYLLLFVNITFCLTTSPLLGMEKKVRCRNVVFEYKILQDQFQKKILDEMITNAENALNKKSKNNIAINSLPCIQQALSKTPLNKYNMFILYLKDNENKTLLPLLLFDRTEMLIYFDMDTILNEIGVKEATHSFFKDHFKTIETNIATATSDSTKEPWYTFPYTKNIRVAVPMVTAFLQKLFDECKEKTKGTDKSDMQFFDPESKKLLFLFKATEQQLYYKAESFEKYRKSFESNDNLQALLV